MEAASPTVALEELRATLARSEQARLAAEARAAALQAGQVQSARELASLQSLFRQAVEENRGLLEQLAASQARVTALEAAAAVAAQAPPRCAEPQSLPERQEQQAERYPAIYARPCNGQTVSHSAAAQQACPQAPASTADQLSRVKRALADQLGPPAPAAQQAPAPPQPQYMTISLPASAPLAGPTDGPAVQPPHQGSDPAPSQLQPAPAPPPPASDMQRVFMELQALQHRLQAAEERLQLQAAGVPQSVRMEQQHTRHPGQAGGGSRPASPGIPARPSLSPARQKEQEHRDSYQLIRELKQRRARLEAERLAAAAAALAASSSLRGASASSPPAAGPHAAPWLFDTRDLPPSAALHQPLPRQPVGEQGRGSGGGRAQQATVHSRGVAGRAAGSKSSGTSPMAWHAANQRVPGTGGASSLGRRRSLSVEPRRSGSREGREPLHLSNRRRSSSRSRSEREELDRLLMAGQPTTLLASGAKATAGGAAGRSSVGQGSKAVRAGGGSWVSSLVLA